MVSRPWRRFQIIVCLNYAKKVIGLNLCMKLGRKNDSENTLQHKEKTEIV